MNAKSQETPPLSSTPALRRIWVFADPHIGHVADGKDGAEWLEAAIDDVRTNVGKVDYVISLGDMTHASQPEELVRYVGIRSKSGLAPWYEISGNHDFTALRAGLTSSIAGVSRYWSLTDGNLAFFSLPHERCNAAGLFLPEVAAWLRQAIAGESDKNIIMCAHTFPYCTVEMSHKATRSLFPRAFVADFLRDVRVDVWLGGHIHSKPQSEARSHQRDGTTFINAAAVSHVYGRSASLSFILEIEPGATTMRARCRLHDEKRDLEDWSLNITLPFPFAPQGAPCFRPVPLDIPSHYGDIEADEVESW